MNDHVWVVEELSKAMKGKREWSPVSPHLRAKDARADSRERREDAIELFPERKLTYRVRKYTRAG